MGGNMDELFGRLVHMDNKLETETRNGEHFITWSTKFRFQVDVDSVFELTNRMEVMDKILKEVLYGNKEKV